MFYSAFFVKINAKQEPVPTLYIKSSKLIVAFLPHVDIIKYILCVILSSIKLVILTQC